MRVWCKLGPIGLGLLLSCRGPDAGEETDPSGSSTAPVELSPPALSWPGDGSTAHRTDPALVWQLARDGDAALVEATYDLEVATEPTFADPVHRVTDLDRLSDTLTLAPGEAAYWRVRTRVGEEVSAWSEPRSFRTWRDSPRREILYQLVVRHFGNHDGANVTDGTLEENGVGTFADIDDRALSRLGDMGITHVYLTGVLRQATRTDWSEIGLPPDDPDILKGRAGSFFAVRDYFDVCPDYAEDPAERLAEFDALLDRIRDAGLRSLIDLVPNHVARSYGSVVRPELDLGVHDDQGEFFSPDNHFFYLDGGTPLTLPTLDADWQLPGMDGLFPPEDGTPGHHVRVTGNDIISYTPSRHDWYETVKLNYGRDFTTGASHFDPLPPTWTFMDEVLAYWQDRGVDGFRCDFAHLVPDEAWAWLIAEAKARDPETWFAAEAYANLQGLVDAGFDAVYEDDTYDLLKGLYNGSHDKFELDEHLAWLDDDFRPHALRYVENHDERRIASPIVSGVEPDDSGFGSMEAGPHVTPISYLAGPGPLMVYNGQTVGEEGAGVAGFSGENGRTSIFDYWRVPALADWVNDGAFDGGRLSPEQRDLHEYHRRLLHLAQHPLVVEGAYYGLDWYNRDQDGYPSAAWAFGRYLPGQERLLVVVTNLALDPFEATIRIPGELVGWAGLPTALRVVQLFDETGDATAHEIGETTAAELPGAGFSVTLPNQATRVYLLEPRDQALD